MSTYISWLQLLSDLPAADCTSKPQPSNHVLTFELCVSGSWWSSEPICLLAQAGCLVLVIEDNNLLYLTVCVPDSVLPDMVVLTEIVWKKLPAVAGSLYFSQDTPSVLIVEASR